MTAPDAGERAVLKELDRLAVLPATREDWRDLYETIEAYRFRCLARAIVASPQRDALVTAIRKFAGLAPPVTGAADDRR